jgi:hypothetical protein
MKMVFIDAQFPDLRGDCYASGRGSGSTTKAAISRAIGNLLKDGKVRRKRISTIKMTVSITEASDGPQIA